MLLLALVVPRLFHERVFLCIRYSVGCFLWVAALGVRHFRRIPTKQYYRTVLVVTLAIDGKKLLYMLTQMQLKESSSGSSSGGSGGGSSSILMERGISQIVDNKILLSLAQMEADVENRPSQVYMAIFSSINAQCET